jgi:DUF1016 N-terminal domain
MKKTPNLPDADGMESALLANIRALIASARNTVARGVDLVQVHTNFEIGRHIVEFEQQGDQRATYGDALLTLLADGLTAEFGKGFGRSNIAYFRSFFTWLTGSACQSSRHYLDDSHRRLAPCHFRLSRQRLDNLNAPSP